MCSLTKMYVFKLTVSVGCGENFGGKNLFIRTRMLATCIRSQIVASVIAHLRFCCVSGSRAKLFTCEKVESPARVIRTCGGETTRLPELSRPPELSHPPVNGW